MSAEGLSLSQLSAELEELRKDRTAFARSLDILRARVRESIESARSFPPLHKWSGARAAIGALELSLQHIEQNIDEHARAIGLVQTGKIPNLDDRRTPLGVIEGGDTK